MTIVDQALQEQNITNQIISSKSIDELIEKLEHIDTITSQDGTKQWSGRQLAEKLNEIKTIAVNWQTNTPLLKRYMVQFTRKHALRQQITYLICFDRFVKRK